MIVLAALLAAPALSQLPAVYAQASALVFDASRAQLFAREREFARRRRSALRAAGEVGLPREDGAAAPSVRCRLEAGAGGVWRGVFEKTCRDGRYSPMDGMIPATFGLESQRGPREQTHYSDYVNLWGGLGPDGFESYEASLVSEAWVLEADGRFHIDQWIFKLNMDGSVRGAMHGGLVEDPQGRVYDSWTDPAEAGDPKFKGKHDALLALWEGHRR